MRSMFRSVLVALVAALALGAVVASAAQAEAEGPFWKIAGKRLASGEESAVAVKSTKSYVFRDTSRIFTCKKMTLERGKIVGSTGSNPGRRKGNQVFEECTVQGDGAGCQVEEGKIRLEPVVYEFGYEKYGELKQRRGKLLALLKPASGSELGRIKLKATEGGVCALNEFLLEGSEVAEVWSGGKAVEVGKEPAQATVSEVNLPSYLKPIRTICVEENGVVTELKGQKIVSFGQEVSLEGKEEIELASKEPFGVFTR